MVNVKVERKSVVSTKEALSMLMIAVKLYPEDNYRALRAQSMVGLLYKTGKRRSEVAQLEMTDLAEVPPHLSVTFIVGKKRVKSGRTMLTREKLLPLSDVFVQRIIDYHHFMQTEHPACQFFYPRLRNLWGGRTVFYKNRHITGKQIYREIKKMNPKAWCHLFRETMGAQVVRSDGATMMAPFKVMNRLDLKSYQTAYNYMRRYAQDVISEEPIKEGEIQDIID